MKSLSRCVGFAAHLLFVGTCLSTTPALAEEAVATAIPDEIVQKMVHDRLPPNDASGAIPQHIIHQLRDAETVLKALDAPASQSLAAEAWSRRSASLRGKRNELTQLSRDVLPFVTAKRTKAAGVEQAQWKTLETQVQARFKTIDDAFAAIDTAVPGKNRREAISRARSLIQRYLKAAPSADGITDNPIPPEFRELPIKSGKRLPFHVADTRSPDQQRYVALHDFLLFWVSSADAAAPATPSEAAVCSYTAADLADDGHDVILSPEIRALAASLDYSPLKIYQYVQNTIAFEPYYGALKGAAGTLVTQSGGATDQASLLIALLRASNIPARYARGDVSVVDDTDLGAEGRAPKWLGTTTYVAAAQRLSTVDNPHAGITTDPSDVNKSIGIYFSHVWAEACIPYASYRGSQLDKHGHRWLPLDTSVKTSRHIVGIDHSAVFDFNTYLAKRDWLTPLELYQKQVDQAVKTLPPNFATNTVADVPHRWQPLPQPLDVLPITLPFSIQSNTNWANSGTPVASVLPDNHHYYLNISVKNNASTALMPDQHWRLVDIVLKRRTLSFKGVDTAAQNALETWRRDGNMASALPCSINVVPVMKLDGVETAAGSGVVGVCTTDNKLTLTATMDALPTPQLNIKSVTDIGAADTQALMAFAYETSDAVISQRIKSLLATVNTTPNPNTNIDNTEGEFLHIAGLKYLRTLTDNYRSIAALQGNLSDASIHLGRVVAKAKVEYLFDLPYAVNRAGYLIDVSASVANETLAGGQTSTDNFRLQAYDASALEAKIWQEVARLDAVSTTRGLQFARETGIEMLDLTSANWATESPKLTANSNSSLNYTAAGVNNIKTNYIDQGYAVKIPRSLIAYNAVDSSDIWKGTVFAAERTTSPRSLAMIISGGYGGGWSVGRPLSVTTYNPTLNTGFFTPYAPIDLGSSAPSALLWNSTTMSNGINKFSPLAGDPVNVVTGNMYYEEKDISIKGRGGLPIAFERSYNSRGPKDGPLGWGWTHSFNQYVEFRDDNINGVASEAADSDGITSSVAWVDGTGAEKQYAVTGTGSGVAVGAAFTLPSGVYDSISRVSPGIYRITQKNGMIYEFENVAGTVNTRAKLTKISDRNGNALTLAYSGGNLSTVTDGLGRQLVFTYTNNKLTQISDWTGRKHQYQYDANGDLWKHLDPLAVAGEQLPSIYTYYTNNDGAGLAHHMRRHQLPASNGMTYEYYSNGRVFKHYNDLNQASIFSYNDFRRETDVINERGFTRKFFFNQYGSTLKIIEENGAVREYQYDATNTMNLSQETDPLGMTKVYQYDSIGNVTQVTLPSGNTLTYGSFDAFNQPRKNKDARGNYTLFKYDVKGNATDRLVMKAGIGAAIDPVTYTPTASDLVGWVHYSYDSYGNRSTEKRMRNFTAQQGPLVTYNYNDTANNVQGLNMVGITRQGDKNGDGTIAAGETDSVNLSYDPLGRVVYGVDADWQATYASYDSLDRITQATDQNGQARKYRYDANGNKIEVTLDNPYYGTTQRMDSWSAHFDKADRMDTQMSAGGQVTRYTYDSIGNVLSIADPDNYSVNFDYDVAGHAVRSYDQKGNASGRTLDAIGRVRSETDPLGHSKTYAYYGPERDGRLKTVTDAIGRNTTFDYDANGNVITVTDNLGQVTTTQYDELNRPVRIVTPSVTVDGVGARNLVSVYNYDALGSRTRVDAGYTTTPVNSSGDVVATQMTYVFDDFGRKLTETDPLARAWQWEYDVFGNVTKYTEPGNKITQTTWYYGHLLNTITLPDATLIRYTRDALGRVTQLTAPAVTYNYTYDTSLRLATVNDSRGNKTLTYDYSAGGKLNNVLDSSGNRTNYLYDSLGSLNGVWAPNYDLTIFERDAAGRIVQKIMPNGTSTDIAYFNDNRVQAIVNRVNGATTGQHTYTYDQVGNVATRLDQISAYAQSQKYVYDALNRLKEIRNPVDNGLYEIYTYDAFHNRKLKANASGTEYSIHDAAQQLLEMRANNASGALTRAFVYDGVGNVTQKCGGTSVTRTASSCGGSVVLGLSYDARNLLTGATKSNTGVIETYKYDGLGQRIEKVSNTATGTQRYVFSGGHIYSEYGTDWNAAPLTHVYAGSLPLMRAKTFGTGDYFHLDRLGSVSGVTNEAGSLLGFRFYDAFGIGTTQGAIPTYGYTGSEFDGGVGLVHMGARYYDYDVGRFTQPDPLGFIDSVNRYTYALNSPLNYVDPYGTTVRTPLFGDTKKSYVSTLTDMAASFIPGYDLVKAAFNPDATKTDYAIGVIGIIPGFGEVGAGIKGAKALSKLEHTAESLAEASTLARSLPGEAGAIAGKSSSILDNVAGGGIGFDSSRQLRNAMSPGPGEQIHHIVEQTPSNIANFGAQAIHNTANAVPLSASTHIGSGSISAFYSSKVPQISGNQTIRQWLSPQTYDAQYQFGMDTLRQFGAIP